MNPPFLAKELEAEINSFFIPIYLIQQNYEQEVMPPTIAHDGKYAAIKNTEAVCVLTEKRSILQQVEEK